MHAEVQETNAPPSGRPPVRRCSFRETLSRKPQPEGKNSMRNRRKSLIVALLLLLPFGAFGAQPATAAQSTIKGTGVVTGTVTGPKPFTAAHIYLRGQEKPVTFMVFTAGGKYEAINVLPGTYRITAERRGFAPVAQTVTVKAGETVAADLT